jgi:triphosphoribosyl-dephospho-CoA synthase
MLNTAYQSACLAELAALKPGNVHALADGHGMRVEQFVQSAQLSAPWIADAHLSVGQRILQAAQATWQGVGCNTNLGILLLCAPIAHAYQAAQQQFSATALQQTLAGLTVQDAIATYQAIQLMNPAGLGQVSQQDVQQTPSVTLLQAMQMASEYDFIARQYANGFDEILSFGVPLFKSFKQQWEKPGWAITALYLGFLSEFLDSHIVRKLGVQQASKVQLQARQHQQALHALENPKTYFKSLMQWDQQLKNQCINPGTSADLTVATLFVLVLRGEIID